MELRLFVPDTPKRAWAALCYYVRARRSPVRVYGIEDMRREHRNVLRIRGELIALSDKYAAQTAKLVDAQRELSAIKRRGNWPGPASDCKPDGGGFDSPPRLQSRD